MSEKLPDDINSGKYPIWEDLCERIMAELATDIVPVTTTVGYDVDPEQVCYLCGCIGHHYCPFKAEEPKSETWRDRPPLL